jgi:hypothetical protein
VVAALADADAPGESNRTIGALVGRRTAHDVASFVRPEGAEGFGSEMEALLVLVALHGSAFFPGSPSAMQLISSSC